MMMVFWLVIVFWNNRIFQVQGEFIQLTDQEPWHGIVNCANTMGASLVIIGSRGQGTLRRTFLGSVSDSVVHHCHCPVLVCRHPSEHNKQHAKWTHWQGTHFHVYNTLKHLHNQIYCHRLTVLCWCVAILLNTTSSTPSEQIDIEHTNANNKLAHTYT